MRRSCGLHLGTVSHIRFPQVTKEKHTQVETGGVAGGWSRRRYSCKTQNEGGEGKLHCGGSRAG